MTWLETYFTALGAAALVFAVLATIAVPILIIREGYRGYTRHKYNRYLADMEARRKASPANVTVLYTTPSARVRVSK